MGINCAKYVPVAIVAGPGKLLTTLRRKMRWANQVANVRQESTTGRCALRQGRLATLAGLLGQSAAAAFNTSPILIRLSAITPSPTQRFMPSSPL